MRKLTKQKQKYLAERMASKVHDALVKGAEYRYINELNSYASVYSAVDDSVKLILSNLYKDD